MTLNFTNYTNPVHYIQFTNNAVDGMLGISILFSLGIIIFYILNSKGYRLPNCALATAFILNIVGWLMLLLEILQQRVMIFLTALLIGSFLWSSATKP